MPQHPIDRALSGAQECSRQMRRIARPTTAQAALIYDFLEVGGSYAHAYSALCAGRRASRVLALKILSDMIGFLETRRLKAAPAMLAMLREQQRAVFAGDAEFWA